MLPLRPGRKLPQEPVFKHPPLWIHESIAAKLFQAGKEIPVFSRRESKRRALLKLLDRIPLQPLQPRPPQTAPLAGKIDALPRRQPLPKQD
jgi:ABC-type arginine transport system ATPase subunit